MKRLLNKQVTPDQLLNANWNYAGSELIDSDHNAPHSHHRVLTHWRSETGELIGVLLNFVAADHTNERIVMPSSHCEPRIADDLALVDDYGFAVRRSQKRALEWDLLMRLDIERVSHDLQHRLLAH